jgi:endonuclease YncB( thermonuclease family)
VRIDFRSTIGIFPSGAFTRPRLSSSWPCVAVAALALLAATVWALQHDGSIAIAGHPRAIDGDTVAFGRVHVRLYGIAAPESDKIPRGRKRNNWRQPWPFGMMSTDGFVKPRQPRRPGFSPCWLSA